MRIQQADPTILEVVHEGKLYRIRAQMAVFEVYPTGDTDLHTGLPVFQLRYGACLDTELVNTPHDKETK
jgi:hypothetical protein